MKKEITYYKVRFDGVDIPSSYIMNRACYQSLDDAIDYVNIGWKQYADDLFLNGSHRKVINDYVRIDYRGYFRQMTFIDEQSFVRVIFLAVDKCSLVLR